MSENYDDFEAIGDDDGLFGGSGDEGNEDALVSAGGGYGGGSSKPPSDKQIQFAERISKATGVPLPGDLRESWRIASAYIEQNKAKFEKAVKENPLLGGGKATAPSEKQLAFARRIAETLGKTLPDGCDSDWRLTRKFIDDHKIEFEGVSPTGSTGGVPSEKQISLARLISDRGGIPLPDGYDSDWRIVRKFIDEYKQVLDKNAGPRGGKGTASSRKK